MKEITLTKATIRLEEEENTSHTAILFLPGMSGKVFSERFQPIVDTARMLSLPIARVSMWESEQEVNAASFAELHATLGEALDILEKEGYTKIFAVGKSFGGGLLLSYHDARIVKKILWAPAIGFAQEGNFEEWQTRKIGDASFLIDIQLSKDFVSADTAEIDIIHGTADTVMPLLNSQAIVAVASRGALEVVGGADHSYKEPKDEARLMELTREFLK